MTTSLRAACFGSMRTLVTIEGSWNLVVSSKPSCRTEYAPATRRAASASSQMRSSKRHPRIVATVGSMGSSHGAVSLTTETMFLPMADAGVPVASC